MGHKTRARQKGWTQPDYDLDYLLDRFLNDRTFNNIYNTWVAAGYPRHLSPSIDRIDAAKPYCRSNIQMMSTEANCRKADLYERARTEVIMCDEEGNKLQHFPSLTAAARYVGGSIGDIGNCCKDQNYRHKGYRWKYGDRRKYAGKKEYTITPVYEDEDKKFKDDVARYWSEHPEMTAPDVALHFGLPDFKPVYAWKYSYNGTSARLHMQRKAKRLKFPEAIAA